EGNIIWNIVGKGEGMSGTGNFDFNNDIYYKQKTGSYNTKNIKTFLDSNTGSYLMLFNKNTSSKIEYKLEANSNFSKPVGTIISSVTVGKFRQNITTDIDNTEFLNMLKYSLFSK
ncbi:MAG: hypothetical protein Q9M97_03525, partial [Candidatus Gracilibacteria bacterium]|nr:hypothetical protein [Candidatus Gracilibacteria bacterium]